MVDAPVAGRCVLVLAGILLGILDEFFQGFPRRVSIEIEDHSIPGNPDDGRKCVDGMVGQLPVVTNGDGLAPSGDQEGISVGLCLRYLSSGDRARSSRLINDHHGLTKELRCNAGHCSSDNVCTASR